MKLAVALIVLVGLVACVSAKKAAAAAPIPIVAIETKTVKHDAWFSFEDDLFKGSIKGRKIGYATGVCFTLPSTKDGVFCNVLHQFPYGSVSLVTTGTTAVITGGTGKLSGLSGAAKLNIPKAGVYEYIY